MPTIERRPRRVRAARVLLALAAAALTWAIVLTTVGLAAQGAHPYLLLNDWELPAFLDRFAGQRASAFVEGQPVFTYQGAGRTFLFDLMAEREANGAVVTLADATSPLRAAPPAPPPRFLSQ